MRTTIDLDDEVRSELVRRAMARGERGYSHIINDLLRHSLGFDDDLEERERRTAIIRRAMGSISDETAQRMHRIVRESRERWRTDS